MHNSGRLPVNRSQEDPRQFQPHHTARYYAHRVRESLTTRVSKVICSTFLSLVLIVLIVIFILWLSLRPHRPRFHIHKFSVTGLGNSTGFKNATISFNVTVRNPNKHMGIYYESMKGSVYYKDRVIGSTPLLHPFYQQPKNTVIVYKEMSVGNLTVKSHRENDRGQGLLVFRLDITSTIRFKVSTWHSKRHRMHANCDLKVGLDDNILPASKDERCPVYFT